MSADFYNAFDREIFCDEFNPKRQPDYRSVFHQDRDRILTSPAFRRLQTKTQVFQAGEYDFYRTRLTHSLEVSLIAQSIATYLAQKYPDASIDRYLLEGICLAHDIGHPPFGHAGERMLNRIMTPYGGFEGNAQTLRILARTIYSGRSGRSGMSPTRALLDGVLKYKRLYQTGDLNHFIYQDQANALNFCLGRCDLDNELKSIECQIMDLADDIAYSCFDIVDGWKARFITSDELHNRAAQNHDDVEKNHLNQLSNWMTSGKLQPKMNGQVGELIQSASLEERDNFMSSRTRRYSYLLTMAPEAKIKIKLQKSLSKELVYGSSLLQQIEFKGASVLEKLANALLENYLGIKRPLALISDDDHRTLLATDDKSAKARLLCDHLSGMTDAYALRSYKRLFDPDYGSISELI